MCNVDRLKVARKDLPFPHPFNKLWDTVRKIIDTFHMKNHKREQCHHIYNPKVLKDVHPMYNTQACEQTFSWIGRFHRILSAMPKVHNNFFYTGLFNAAITTIHFVMDMAKNQFCQMLNIARYNYFMC